MNPQETQNVTDQANSDVDANKQAQGTPTIEELQNQLIEKDRQLNELGTQKSTLEKIVTDRELYAQSKPFPQAPIQDIGLDLDPHAKQIFERAINDGDTEGAARQLSDLLRDAEQGIVNKVSRDFQTVLAVKESLADIESRKPYLKGFKNEIQDSVARNINQGYDYKKAVEMAEHEYDQKLQGLNVNNANNQPIQKASNPVPGGAVGYTGYTPAPLEEAAPKEQSYQQYLDSRKNNFSNKVYNIRK